MNILQVNFGPMFNSAGGVEKVFCNYNNYFAKKHNVLNLINDTNPGKILFDTENMKIINLGINYTKYTIPLPFKVRLKHLLTHNFRKYINPREKYFHNYFISKIYENVDLNKIDLIICYNLLEYKMILKTNVDRKKIILMFHIGQIETFLSHLKSEELSALKDIGAIQVLYR